MYVVVWVRHYWRVSRDARPRVGCAPRSSASRRSRARSARASVSCSPQITHSNLLNNYLMNHNTNKHSNLCLYMHIRSFDYLLRRPYARYPFTHTSRFFPPLCLFLCLFCFFFFLPTVLFANILKLLTIMYNSRNQVNLLTCVHTSVSHTRLVLHSFTWL